MNTTSIYQKLLLLIFTISFLIGCQGKKKQDYISAKKDMKVLVTNWKQTQIKLRTNLDALKGDLQEFNEVEQDLTKILKTRKPAVQKEVGLVMKGANEDLAALRQQMDSLNAFSKEWNIQSKSLNQLTQQLEAQELDPSEVKTRIASLRQFKAMADPKLIAIEENINAYRSKNRELKSYLDKFRKKKASQPKRTTEEEYP